MVEYFGRQSEVEVALVCGAARRVAGRVSGFTALHLRRTQADFILLLPGFMLLNLLVPDFGNSSRLFQGRGALVRQQ